MDASFLAPYKAVVRWFTTCVAQPEFLAVLGPTKLCGGAAAPAPAAAAAAAAPKAAAPKKEAAPKAEKARPVVNVATGVAIVSLVATAGA